MRRKATGAVDSGFPKAEKLAYRPEMYRLASPPAGVDRDIVDKLWEPSRTVCATWSPGSLPAPAARGRPLLFAYAATAGVRHPRSRPWPPTIRRSRAAARRATKCSTRACSHSVTSFRYCPTWRWRVLHSPADAPRFMITDRGWMYVGQEDWPTHGLLLPMGPRVAILGYLDDPGLAPGRLAFEEHLDLCQSTINLPQRCRLGRPLHRPSDRPPR